MSQILFLCSLLPILVTPQTADSCDPNQCKIQNNCQCSSTQIPLPNDSLPPQFIAITITDPVNQADYDEYWKPLSEYKNPDGSPIGFTFFVPHEFTDYALVQDLYVQGHEIGVSSITNEQNASYWRTASQQQLEAEFGGEKAIISTFAKIPSDDITGVRTPLLQVNGDTTFKAYTSSDFSYDNSWPTRDHFFPYTLDYLSTQNTTTIPSPPRNSYPNFWVLPIVHALSSGAGCQSNLLEDCYRVGSVEYIAENLMDEALFASGTPLTYRMSSRWFRTNEHSYEGFKLFLERARSVDYIFFVTGQEIIQWMHKPIVASDYKRPSYSDREKDCLSLICPLKYSDQTRFMKSCIPCSDKYPWIDNLQEQS